MSPTPFLSQARPNDRSLATHSRPRRPLICFLLSPIVSHSSQIRAHSRLVRKTDKAVVQGSPESALEMYEFAKSMLIECKESVRLDDLDTAIRLFREALLQRPASHPMRMYALHNLAMGLVTRFNLLGRMEDLDEAIALVCRSGTVRPDVLGDGSGNPQANVSLRYCIRIVGMLMDDFSWTTSRKLMIGT